MKARHIINRAKGQGARVKDRGAKPKIHIKQKTNIFQKMLDLLGCLCYNGITSEGLFFCAKKRPNGNFSVCCMCFALPALYVGKCRYALLLREAEFAEKTAKIFSVKREVPI